MKISKGFFSRLALASSLVLIQSFYMKAEDFPQITFQQHLKTIVGDVKDLSLKVRGFWTTNSIRTTSDYFKND